MQTNHIELIPICSYCQHFNPSGTHCGMCRRRLKPVVDNNVRNTPTQIRDIRKSGFPRATLASPYLVRHASTGRVKMTKAQSIDQLLSE